MLVVLVPILGVLVLRVSGGADEQARAAIEEAHSYRAWFEPLWSPSPAVEKLLFLAQAVVGSLVLGYAILRLRARRKP
jgi:cobalt transport protein